MNVCAASVPANKSVKKMRRMVMVLTHMIFQAGRPGRPATASPRRRRSDAPKALFRQADLLAKSFQPRIAAKQSQFREAEYRARPNRPYCGHASESLQGAFLIAQTREDQGSLLRRKIRCQLFSLFAAAG